MNEQDKALFEKIKNLLGDRFSHYVVIALDGDGIHSINSSETVALGLIARFDEEIRNSFHNDVVEEEDE